MSRSFSGIPTLRLERKRLNVRASSATQCMMGLMESMYCGVFIQSQLCSPMGRGTKISCVLLLPMFPAVDSCSKGDNSEVSKFKSLMFISSIAANFIFIVGSLQFIFCGGKLSFNCKLNFLARDYQVTLRCEFYKSTESALERAESMDGLGDLVGICLNGMHGFVSKEVC